ncbi:hypothetical protein DPMN_145925 [Dreissena polymorpha]|uniref:Uncharacterized protein n=1 Tax=Dreissena polymorpha TaxID=45954 RepID=A0A9D4F4Z1_DREPO|nr:hypothetical protein DPMN_145925 [Dreissena polymorpha]
MGPCIAEIDCIVIREVQYQFEVNRCRHGEIIVKGNFGWAWPMLPGRPRIDRIVIREVQYQFDVNRCRIEEFQGSSANSVGGAGGRDGRTDGQTHITTISPLSEKLQALISNGYWDTRDPGAIPYLFANRYLGSFTCSTRINILTKFYKDWTKTVTSTVYTNKLLTINILTKFHKDWMKTACDLYCLHKQIVDGHTHTHTDAGHGHISSPCHFVTGDHVHADQPAPFGRTRCTLTSLSAGTFDKDRCQGPFRTNKSYPPEATKCTLTRRRLPIGLKRV